MLLRMQIRITVVLDDITRQRVDAIVSEDAFAAVRDALARALA